MYLSQFESLKTFLKFSGLSSSRFLILSSLSLLIFLQTIFVHNFKNSINQFGKLNKKLGIFSSFFVIASSHSIWKSNPSRRVGKSYDTVWAFGLKLLILKIKLSLSTFDLLNEISNFGFLLFPTKLNGLWLLVSDLWLFSIINNFSRFHLWIFEIM